MRTPKTLIRKAEALGTDPYWAILNYRNTGISSTVSQSQLREQAPVITRKLKQAPKSQTIARRLCKWRCQPHANRRYIMMEVLNMHHHRHCTKVQLCDYSQWRNTRSLGSQSRSVMIIQDLMWWKQTMVNIIKKSQHQLSEPHPVIIPPPLPHTDLCLKLQATYWHQWKPYLLNHHQTKQSLCHHEVSQ